MNTTQFGASVMVIAAIAIPAAADDTYYDTARVLSVVPQTERINTPRQECRTEYDRGALRSGDRDIGGAIIGGIAGGLLGSQIGKGKGRVAGAAVGAATGALVGDRIDNSDQNPRSVERCTVVDNWQSVNRGYLVTYRYNGRTYSTTMPNDPGDTLTLRVSVVPDMSNVRVSSWEDHDNGWHRGWDKHRERHERWDD